MGSIFSSLAPPSDCTELVHSKGLRKDQLIAVSVKGNELNFYDLLGFAHYSSPSAKEVATAFRKQSLLFHPDKYHGDDKEEKAICSVVFTALVTAKETLTVPALKKRYDLLLKEKRGELTCLEWLQLNGRWLVSALASSAGVLGPLALAMCSCYPPGWAGVATAALLGTVGGAGTAGRALASRDPDQELGAFMREVAQGAVQGAVLGVACQAGVGALTAIGSGTVQAVQAAAENPDVVGQAGVTLCTHKVKVALGSARGVAQVGLQALATGGQVLATGAQVGGHVMEVATSVTMGAFGMQFAQATHGAAQIPLTVAVGGVPVGKAVTAGGGQLLGAGAQARGKVAAAVTQGSSDWVGLIFRAFFSGAGQLAIACATEQEARMNEVVFATRERSENYLELMAKDMGHGVRQMANFEGAKLLREVADQLDPQKRSVYEKLAEDLENYAGHASEACLRAYTAESKLYKAMNNALLTDQAELWLFANYIHNLRAEVRLRGQQRGFFCKGTVWRGARFPKHQEQMWTTVGSKFLNAGFMSTSKDRRVAEGFAQRAQEAIEKIKVEKAEEFEGKQECAILLEIDCTGNLRERGVSYAVDIEGLSMVGGESEVLFYPYSGFEVISGAKVGTLWHIKLHVLDTEMVERRLRCPKGHKLYELSTENPGSCCGRCGSLQAQGTTMRGCLECHHHVCGRCL